MAYTPLFDSGENLLIEKMLEESKGTGSDEMRLFRLKWLLKPSCHAGPRLEGPPSSSPIEARARGFWTSLALNYLRGPEKVERALEDLVDCVEDLHPNRTLAEALEYLIVITPTRMLYIPAEVQMGNRVLREFGGPDAEKMIRVVFREDNGGLLRAIARHEGIRARVGTFLEHGPVVGGQKFVFLGQSNSQLRDQGAYFYMGSDRDANKIRTSLGQFNKLNSVAKMVARMGQCFTQSKESPIELPRKQYEEEADYFGGSDYVDVKKLTTEEAANLKAEEPYTFSDGVGRISESYLKKIASMSDYRYKDHTPSCVQPSSKADPKGKKRAKEVNIVFRESQKKFEAPRKHQSGESMKFEVVKFGGPSPVSLNRPFINILCQVAEHQGQQVHDRVQGRILTLLDHHAVRESQTDTLFTPCPGTKYTRAPDFMHRDFDPAYRCRRTVGMVYRGIKEIQKIVEDSLEGDNEVNIELDPAFNHPGWENMKEEAEAGLIEWSQGIKRVLDHYGVASAAEIITGCVMAMRNKAAESDGDQVTYFTTSQTIESTGHHIGDYEMLTEPYEEHWANEAHPLHRQVKQPTVAMLQKATAYYKVAYEFGGVRVSALGCAASLRRLREALMLDPIIQYERYGPGIDAEYASRVRTRVNELIAPQIVPEI
ncbi:unnamed protein product, partial [Mesorhabditis spiculigera]